MGPHGLGRWVTVRKRDGSHGYVRGALENKHCLGWMPLQGLDLEDSSGGPSIHQSISQLQLARFPGYLSIERAMLDRGPSSLAADRAEP